MKARKKSKKTRTPGESFESRLERILKTTSVSPRSTEELFASFSSNHEARTFLRAVSQDLSLMNLLFLHKDDLLGSDDGIQLPYLQMCRISNGAKNEDSDVQSKSLASLVSGEALSARDFPTVIQELFGIGDDEWKILKDNLKDVIAYFAILLIRENKKIKKLVDARSFNYRLMKKVLGDYTDSVDLSVISEEVGEDGERLDPIVRAKLKDIAVKAATGLAKNIERLMDFPDNIFPRVITSIHLTAGLRQKQLLKASGLSFDEYIGALDELHRYNLIENKSTIQWCENCCIDNPVLQLVQGRVAPSKIPRPHCLSCNREMSYASVFSIKQPLRDAVLSKDGFLPVFLASLLEDNGLESEINRYDGDYENDFIVNGTTLIECKRYRMNKDKTAIRSELTNVLSSLRKHVKALKDEGREIKKVYLAWNRRDDGKALLQSLKTKYADMFKEHEFGVLCPEDLEETLRELAQDAS